MKNEVFAELAFKIWVHGKIKQNFMGKTYFSGFLSRFQSRNFKNERQLASSTVVQCDTSMYPFCLKQILFVLCAVVIHEYQNEGEIIQTIRLLRLVRNLGIAKLQFEIVVRLFFNKIIHYKSKPSRKKIR